MEDKEEKIKSLEKALIEEVKASGLAMDALRMGFNLKINALRDKLESLNHGSASNTRKVKDE